MSEDNVIKFPDIYHMDPYRTDSVPTEKVLEGISANNLETVIVLGYTQDGEEYFASSVADGGTILWLLERLKKKLLEVPDDYSF